MKREEYIQFVFTECLLRTNHWARPASSLEIYTAQRCIVGCFPLPSFHILFDSLILLQGPSGLRRGQTETREEARKVLTQLVPHGQCKCTGWWVLMYLQKNPLVGVLLTWAGIFWLANFKCLPLAVLGFQYPIFWQGWVSSAVT